MANLQSVAGDDASHLPEDVPLGGLNCLRGAVFLEQHLHPPQKKLLKNPQKSDNNSAATGLFSSTLKSVRDSCGRTLTCTAGDPFPRPRPNPQRNSGMILGKLAAGVIIISRCNGRARTGRQFGASVPI